VASGADRRIVSALFADLVDYVRMIAEHDPEDVKQHVDAALAAMADAVHRFDGTIEKFIGDAVFAVFGYPRAHDDDALRAALCATAIRDSMALLSRGSEVLQVRIGIATGEVVAAHRDGPGGAGVALTGPAVVTAARIQDLARPGEVLLDEATVRAARGRLDVEDRGLELLRGQTRPIRLYGFRGEPSLLRSWGPPRGRIVGRTAERGRLREALATTAATGRGRAIVVSGEAGMGKSRLLADLEADARAAGFAWTWTENVSYGTGEPYRFIRHFAQTLADEHGTDSGTLARRLIFTGDLAPEAAQRMAGAIAAVARDADFSGWEAEAELAPTDPAEVVRVVLEVALLYTRRLAEAYGPRVIVVDDVHWADRSSLPMLEQLVRETPGLPFVVLVGSRPAPRPEWLATAEVDWLELTGLGPDETEQLAAEIAGAPLDPRDSLRLHERTDGNPLFIGEVLRAHLDEGSLGRDGRLPLDVPLAGGRVPLTLRALLGARIDALPDDAREVLGVASVVGIAFQTGLVGELLGAPVDPAALARLAESTLVVGAGTDTWRFGHPLIRDVAYAGLLASRRRELHGRLADRLEGLPGAAIGRIAQHRAAAGDSERAVPLLDVAALEAMSLGASAEAAGFWRSAAELLAAGPEADRFRALAAAALVGGAAAARPEA
jgi:class 3 adenylate cyclase